jgi:hypothetical protein
MQKHQPKTCVKTISLCTNFCFTIQYDPFLRHAIAGSVVVLRAVSTRALTTLAPRRDFSAAHVHLMVLIKHLLYLTPIAGLTINGEASRLLLG